MEKDQLFFTKLFFGVLWWVALWGIIELIIEHYTKRSLAMRAAFYVTILFFVLGMVSYFPDLKEAF